MKESKFNFVPVKKGRKKEGPLLVSVGKSGVISCGIASASRMGVDAARGTFFRLFYDEEKRSLAWKFTASISDSERFKGNWRKATIIRDAKSHVPVTLVMSVSAVKGIKARVAVSRYKDTIYGDLFYVALPRPGTPQPTNEREPGHSDDTEQEV